MHTFKNPKWKNWYVSLWTCECFLISAASFFSYFAIIESGTNCRDATPLGQVLPFFPCSPLPFILFATMGFNVFFCSLFLFLIFNPKRKISPLVHSLWIAPHLLPRCLQEISSHLREWNVSLDLWDVLSTSLSSCVDHVCTCVWTCYLWVAVQQQLLCTGMKKITDDEPFGTLGISRKPTTAWSNGRRMYSNASQDQLWFFIV